VVDASALDLSIIIVTWNVRELARACLAALPGATEGTACEVIVVDNASADRSADMVAAEFPNATLLRNEANIGFARANNQGLAVAGGRYFVLLNADTIPHSGSLSAMVAFMDAHSRAGAASPRLLRPDGTPQPYAFGSDPSPLYLLQRAVAHLRKAYLHDWGVSAPRPVEWVSGACLVTRREAVDRVGGLDEHIFMYFEDNDWCRRMRLAGWEVWYNPGVEITHIGGASLNQNPRARAAYYESLAYFYRKHYGQLAGAVMELIVSIRNHVFGSKPVS
jgi:N-acetylglucosaminyl-diphospho-decaprenol L-rhamnosyltransferase